MCCLLLLKNASGQAGRALQSVLSLCSVLRHSITYSLSPFIFIEMLTQKRLCATNRSVEKLNEEF